MSGDLFRFASVLVCAILASASQSIAQDDAMLSVLYPQVGQRGTTVTVTIEGCYLDELAEVLFYETGIRCAKLEPGADVFNHRDGRISKSKPGRAARLTFEIAKNARIGEYKLRVRTKDNLSEMLTFRVTPFPVVEEEHKWQDRDKTRNDSIAFAQPVPMECTVYGYLPGNQPQDHDFYCVECKRGQRLTVESVAARMGTLHYGGMNDPAIKVFDASGKELARNDDNSLLDQDAVVSLVVPRDGKYFVDMHQQMDYEAGRLRHYLLHITTAARTMVVYPLGGKAGTNQLFGLLGDVRGDRDVNVGLPKNSGLFEQAYFDFANVEKNTSSPLKRNRVHVSEFDHVMEADLQSSNEHPQVIGSRLPIAINGRITSEGEVDWYRFKAKKGERYRVRTYAKTLRWFGFVPRRGIQASDSTKKTTQPGDRTTLLAIVPGG